MTLLDIYVKNEDQERIIDLIKIFEKAIDTINQEIIVHLNQRPEIT